MKNKNNKNSSIVVKFYPATTKEIKKLLDSHNLFGVKVSNIINRWAIDVPFWKEEYYCNKLSESELVEKTYRNPNSKQSFIS
jgi:hypothetical protein